MAEYIDRAELIKNLNKFTPEYYNALINQLITKQPTADVVEVKHGTWVKEKEYEDGKIDYKCSVCDYDDTFTETTIAFQKYCNYCGAKMDGTPKERGGEK